MLKCRERRNVTSELLSKNHPMIHHPTPANSPEHRRVVFIYQNINRYNDKWGGIHRKETSI